MKFALKIILSSFLIAFIIIVSQNYNDINKNKKLNDRISNFRATGSDLSIKSAKLLIKKHFRKIRSEDDYKLIIKKKKEKLSENIVPVRNTIFIENNADFDGLGKIFVWVGNGNCGQKEGMPPMFVLKDNSSIRNIIMINAPDGIHLMGNNTKLESIVNLNVCEDAVSTKLPSAKDITISNSFFYSCEDKALQFNYGDTIKVFNTSFINCAQPIRIPTNSKFVGKDNIMHGVKSYYYLRSKN